ncbi:hypothetical protein CWR48_07985 [Oceanobacillus arenosus]|uniref:Uncharacterized protein n=1 Tax=Oceanobacillus arenosus TaxID=1229153 RepID=A0A3D8PVU7_9BACI|nr:hypothetical protein CWR48_07985 [Oceanobacillus arenosus]
MGTNFRFRREGGFSIRKNSRGRRKQRIVYFGYLIFSIFATIAAMEINKVLFFVLLLLDIEFFGLFLNSFNMMYSATYTMAAIAELLVALVSFYGFGAVLINTCFKKVLLPLGNPFGIFVK